MGIIIWEHNHTGVEHLTMHLHIGHAMINFICATRNWRINRQKLTMTAAIELIITPSKKNTKMWVTSGEQVNPGYITSTVAAPLCLYKVCTPHGQVWRSCAHLNKRQAAWDSGSWPPSLAQLRPQSFTKQKHDKDKVQALSVSQKNYDLWRKGNVEYDSSLSCACNCLLGPFRLCMINNYWAWFNVLNICTLETMFLHNWYVYDDVQLKKDSLLENTTIAYQRLPHQCSGGLWDSLLG